MHGLSADRVPGQGSRTSGGAEGSWDGDGEGEGDRVGDCRPTPGELEGEGEAEGEAPGAGTRATSQWGAAVPVPVQSQAGPVAPTVHTPGPHHMVEQAVTCEEGK